MSSKQENEQQKVRVWDLPTRFFHWSLVLALIVAWASNEFFKLIDDNQLLLHRYTGYFIIILLIYRVFWALWGSSTSRWHAFFVSPNQVLTYFKMLFSGKKQRYLGHNPIGAVMILALLGFVLLQGMLGLFIIDGEGFVTGPLEHLISEKTADIVRHFHHKIFDFIVILACLHVFANIVYGLLFKEPLIPAMVHGKKPALKYHEAQEAQITSPIWAILSFLLAVICFFGLIYGLGGKL